MDHFESCVKFRPSLYIIHLCGGSKSIGRQTKKGHNIKYFLDFCHLYFCSIIWVSLHLFACAQFFCLQSNTFKLITYVDANGRSVYHSISSLNEHTHTHMYLYWYTCANRLPINHHIIVCILIHLYMCFLQGGTEIEGFGCIMVTTCCRCLRFHKTSRTCSRL